MTTVTRATVAMLSLLLGTSIALGQEGPISDIGSLAACASFPELRSGSRQLYELRPFVSLLALLEAQGEARFRPEYPAPKTECLRDRFTVGTTSIASVYAPWEQGDQTLHYRFVAGSGDERREVLLLYSGVVGFLHGWPCFYLVETRTGRTSYYAMFQGQPRFEPVKTIVAGIFDGRVEPSLVVHWPPRAKEPIVDKGNGYLRWGESHAAGASERDLPWAFKTQSADGYSIDPVSVEPMPGTPLSAGSSIEFKVTVTHAMSVAEDGMILLIFQDEKNRSLTAGVAPVSKEVRAGNGNASLSATVNIPKKIREVRLFVPLSPTGLEETTGELTFRYPVVRHKR
jgi:hypothetical protein